MLVTAILAAIGLGLFWRSTSASPSLPVVRRIGDPTEGYASVLAFSPDGRTLATGGEWLILRDPSRNEAPRFLAPGNSERSRVTGGRRDDGMLTLALAFCPKRSQLASGDHNGRVRIWDVESGAVVAEFDGHDGRRILALAYAPDGTTLASAGDDRRVRIWDLVARTEKLGFENEESRSLSVAGLPRPSGSVLAFRASDRNLVAVDFRQFTSFRILEAETGAVETVRTRIPQLWPFALSPDARFLAAGDSEKTGIWDVQSGRLRTRLEEPLPGSWGTPGAAYSPDGRWVAMPWVSPKHDWVKTLTEPERKAVGALGFAPTLLNAVAVHEASTGKLVALLAGQSAAAFSPARPVLATTDGHGVVTLWDTSGLKVPAHDPGGP